MLGPRRDHDDVARGDRPRLAGDVRRAGAADEGEDLVVVLVHLGPDLLAREQGHGDQLGVCPGPQDPAEVGAGLGQG